MSVTVSNLGSITKVFQRGTKAYDLLATTPLIAWYVTCLFAAAPPIVHGFESVSSTGVEIRLLLSLLSQISKFSFALLLIALLIVRRTPISGSQSFAPKFIAFLGGYLGIALLVLPGRGADSDMLLLSSFLTFFGMTFSVFSLAWLGRSISLLPESRKLVTSGPYAMIRHPLYLGEQIALVGVALQVGTLWAVAAITLQFCCQLYRMSYEERVLSGSFPEYEEYMADTARLIPGLY
jgi:protein-S-isoprenylcysteine O-methyltransferase Ste14